MFDLRKLFVREARRERGQALDPDSDYHPSDRKGEGLEVEYQSVIATQFRRWGLSTHSVTIEVRRIGHAPDGFDVLVGMVRLGSWHRLSALRLLLGLPLLEAKVRKAVRATWLADYSHFGGLWLHASERVIGDPGASTELRQLLMQLTPPAAAGPAQAGEPSSAADVFSSLSPSSQPAMSRAGPPSSAAPVSMTPGTEPGDSA